MKQINIYKQQEHNLKMERVASDMKHVLSLCGRGPQRLCLCLHFLTCKTQVVTRSLLYCGKAFAKLWALWAACRAPYGLRAAAGNVSRSRTWLNEVSQITEWEWALLPQLNVVAGVIYLETSKMFREKLTLCPLRYLLLNNYSSFQSGAHLSFVASFF